MGIDPRVSGSSDRHLTTGPRRRYQEDGGPGTGGGGGGEGVEGVEGGCSRQGRGRGGGGGGQE